VTICRLLPAPWATATVQPQEVVVGQRPLLLVDPDVTAVRAREQRIDLPRVGVRGIEGREWAMFELAGTAPDAAAGETLDLEFERGRQLIRQCLSIAGGLCLITDGQERIESEVGPSEHVHGFLGRHVDLIYGATEGARPVDGAGIGLDLAEFLSDWRKSEETEQAKLALIVKLADAIGRTVAEIAERPRRILRRRRSMERVSSVRQIDPAGVRWLVRQPGRNLAERAGPRQRILAVTRDESVDTLENRVMRDLLERSASEARLWLRDNRDFVQSDRWRTVDRYHTAVRRWRRIGPLSEVRPVHGPVEPNYVLQHDPRYSQVWPWYQALRRRQEQEDQLWRWSHRTFGETLRLALAWAVDELCFDRPAVGAPQYARALVLREEQQHGEFVDPRSQFAGWLVGTGSGPKAIAVLSGDRIRRFEDKFVTGSRLHELAPDALVVLHDPFRPQKVERLLAIWTRLHFEPADPGRDTVLDLAESVARQCGTCPVQAALVEPTPTGEGAAELDERRCPVTQGQPVTVWLVRAPLRPAKTRTRLLDLLNQALLSEVSW
jgi:hypothetical protein